MGLSWGLTETMATLVQSARWVGARVDASWRVVLARWRLLRRVAVAGLLVVAALVAYQKRSELSTAAGTLGHLRVGWIAVAVVAEIVSMVAFGGLHRWLLHSGGVDVSLMSMVEIVLAGKQGGVPASRGAELLGPAVTTVSHLAERVSRVYVAFSPGRRSRA